ncbi:MAG: UDP-N-acetylmuramate dehydrogenase [Bacteroidales bacterium]|nr:UDP-N-acetylmuramate dehydrogenase [Candidatus Cryptobacteroides aphodequi]
MRRIENFDLSAYNTFRMKVSCALYIEYDSIEELKGLDFSSLPQPVMSIGEGANLLFTQDFPGTVLHSAIRYIRYFDVGGDTVPVAVGAGVKFDDFIAKACGDGLWGVENLSAIPGSVGACAVQNVGAYGSEAGDVVAGVTCYDTLTHEKCSFKAEDCRFGYRDSIFKDPLLKGRYVITGVLFRLKRTFSPKLEYKGIRAALGLDENTPAPKTLTPADVRNAVIAIRAAKLPDPAIVGSAGSFFKNPVVSAAEFARISDGYTQVPHYLLEGGFIKVPAAWLIDQCGLKGFRLGGAAVHDTQPLVLINASGDARPDEILALEQKIKDSVRERFGVSLEPEVEHI